ncbi:auxin efflux carrier superfamily [Talaromyces proteolyticus]|uniref:Auxin efflux carrier superfamily n=1 Tax=Talaromyces proteolyticus TaxID=1131652 RepID=A0AAD4L2H5_9EURO|nr:auxin efflux carrier superfamily [Talaromyces proteolyticus]KAH8702014.1 auxin efflux carrier superfamily [Talaromyces proteolyticus]
MPRLEDGLVPPFLGALQACTSVLLTLFYGLVTRQANIIHEQTINDMSGLCVKLFLPALIMVKLGSELHLETALNYVPVFVWAISYTGISVIMGYILSYLLKLPQWVTPTVASNNTSSLPLLLLETLRATGSLRLITLPGQSQEDAMNRAQSYFLVCAVTTKTISYAIGPRMLQNQINHDTEETTQPQQQPHDMNDDNNNIEDRNSPATEEEANEQTSLLPRPVQRARHKFHKGIRYLFSFVPRFLRRGFSVIDSPFLDLAILCTATGVLFGLVPKLHRAFFASYEEGGIFQAWLTSSVENIGGLFTSLQVFLVGCKLGVSFEKMRRSKRSGGVPIRALLVVFCVRLVVWPAISISGLYFFIRYTKVLPHDPVLWFSMMVMPTGPPALIISGLAELEEVSELEKMAIAKIDWVQVMYMLSPVVSFTITGALKVTEALLNSQGKG